MQGRAGGRRRLMLLLGFLSGPPGAFASNTLRELPPLPDPCVAFGSVQDGAFGPALSPDGTSLYVPCDDRTVVIDRDPSTGGLSNPRSGPVTGDLIFTPDGTTAWARGGAAGTRTLARDASGDLTVVGDAPLVVPRYLEASPDGRYLYGSWQGRLQVYDPDPLTGDIAQLEEFVYQHAFDSVDGALAFSPDGLNVYYAPVVLDAGNPDTGVIDVYARDTVTGLLTLIDRLESGLAGIPDFQVPSAIEVSPDGAHVYVTVWFDASVLVFSRDASTGLLTPVESVHGKALPLISFRGNEAVMDAGGSSLVVRTYDDGLVVFHRNPELGLLSFVEHTAPFDPIEGITPSESVVWAPDGGNLYAPDFAAGTVRVYEPRRACAASPMPACSMARKATVKVKRDPVGLRSKVVVKWTGATAVLGDPSTTTALALCLYDAAGLQLDIFVPPSGTCGTRPCWQAQASGLKYRNTAFDPDGVQKVVLTGSGGTTTKAIVKGKGGLLPMPGLLLTGAVVAQLQSSDGGCLEATVVPRRNDAGLFVGKVP